MTDNDIRRAVADGRLLRPRGGSYLPGGTDSDLVEACRLRARLGCVSEALRQGIFVLDASTLHVHHPAHAALHGKHSRPVRHHWGRLVRQPHPRSTAVEVFDALLQAVRCQPPRAAVAMLDSALHLGRLDPDDLDELFGALPRRYRRIRGLLDARAESGSESFLRLMLRSLGVEFEVQVRIDGVGRVDFVVEGWLIVECDSRAHHSDWAAQRRDRRRDQAAAALGYATYRPIAEDILWHPAEVLAALRGLVHALRRR